MFFGRFKSNRLNALSAGDHNHDADYEPLDSTILRDADIGVTVEASDAAIVKSDVNKTITASWTHENTLISEVGFTALNPGNQSASVGLNWLSNVARLRVGGSGAGATGGLKIQKAGDVNLVAWDNNGNQVSLGTIEGTSLKENGEFLANKYSKLVPTIITKTASHVLIASDNGNVILFNTGSNVNLEMETGLGEGFNCQVINIHPTGVVTLTDGGLTLNAKATKLSSQWGGCTVLYIAPTSIVALGDLTVS